MDDFDFEKLFNENFGLLKKDYNDYKNERDSLDIIPFIGAGASIPLGLPSWEDLVKKFHNSFGCVWDFEIEFKKCNRNYASITERIFNEKKDVNRYNNFMANAQIFSPRTTSATILHKRIIKAFDKILTTNYDTTFEVQCLEIINDYEQDGTPNKATDFKFKTFSYPELSAIKFYKAWEKKKIAYLHGSVANNLKKYVFRESEYKLAYGDIGNPETSLVAFLREIYENTIVVFIGFSFDDLYFRNATKRILLENIIKLNEKMKEVYGSNYKEKEHPGHYIFIDENKITPYVSKNSLPEDFFKRNSLFFTPTNKINNNGSDEYLKILLNHNDLMDNLISAKDKLIWEEILLLRDSRLNKLNFLNENKIRIIPYRSGYHKSIEDSISKLTEKPTLDSFIPDEI